MILGAHTVAELRDLLAHVQYALAQLSQAYASAAPGWVTRDPTGFVSWTNDWTALKTRFDAAAAAAESALADAKWSLIPDDANPAEATYQGILSALGKGESEASFDGLFRRVTAAGIAVDLSHDPAPTAKDIDLSAYQATDAASRAMPMPVKTFVATATPGLVPKTADQGNYKPVAKSTWWLLGLALVGGGLLVSSVLRPMGRGL